MKRGLALSLSALLLAAVLTGCTGAPAPSAEASPAPSPTPAVSTATPAPTPQVTPTLKPQVYTAGVLTDSDYTNTCLGFRFAPQGSILMPGPDALGSLMINSY